MRKIFSLIVIGVLCFSMFSMFAPQVKAMVYNYSITDITQTAPDTIVVSLQCLFCSACNPNDPSWPDRGTGCTPFGCGYPPSSFPSYVPCQHGSPNGRYAAVRLKGSFGSVVQKLICDQSNWPLNTLWSHNFVFSGLVFNSGETITIEADFYCSYCYHWYATPKTFVPQKYTFVFIPFHWDGALGSNTPGSETRFFAEVKKQKQLIIDSIGTLTNDNTEVITVGENLIFPDHTYWNWLKLPPGWDTIQFSETDVDQAQRYMDIHGWSYMVTFATNHGVTGDRFITITNKEMWDTAGRNVEGWSNWGPTAIAEDSTASSDYAVLHELGHSWRLLDEYNYTTWYDEASRILSAPHYGYDSYVIWLLTGHPPNSYPGDDTPGTGTSNGHRFDSKRCIMGPANPWASGRGFCPSHQWDDPNRDELGAPRSYEGCSAHVEETINSDIGISSAGLASVVITFYSDQSIPPMIQEITGLPIVGKSLQYSGPSNYSIQVLTEEGKLIYDSNVSLSFTSAFSQYLPGLYSGVTSDFVTLHWLAPMFSETTVTVALRDNVENQVIATQAVTITPTAEAWIDYKKTDKTTYGFADLIEVTAEVNTTATSMNIILDATLSRS